MTKSGSTRVTITITNTVLNRVDKYAEELGITRSAAISVLCSQMLDSISMTRTLEAARQGQKLDSQQVTFDQMDEG